jgi:hypothetical protein
VKLRFHLLWLALPACAGSVSALQLLSAQAIDCPAREITTSDQQSGQVVPTLRWKASCRGERYECSKVEAGSPTCLKVEPGEQEPS